MVATHSTLAGFLALSAVSATPFQVSSEARSFKLPLTRRANKAIDDTSLTNIYTSTDWTTVVSFGGQNFSLQVDSGSSDIWVLSTEMSPDDRKAFPSNHFYDGSKSKNFKLVDGGKFNISYSAGEIFGAGKVATDDVAIGSASVNMPFGVATQVSPQGMVDTMYDGILGLAFGAHNTQSPKQGPTFMEAVQSQLDEPVFTFNLPNTASGQMLEFGHVDKNLYNGTLQTAKIDNGTASMPIGWVGSASFSVGGKNISTQMDQLLFDTGGLSAAANDKAVEAYWGNVKGSKDLTGDGTGWAFPCSVSSLPDLSYDFVGMDGKTVSAVVPGKFMNSTSTSSDSSMCMGSFQGLGGMTFGTVGYGFFHSFFTVFDQSKPSVSFAPYPEQELDGQALVVSSSGAPSATTLSGTATATSSQGFKSKPTGGATGTQASNGTSVQATGSATKASSGAAVAITAAPTGASDAAPGASSNGSGQSAASGITIPSLAVAIFAVTAGLLVL